MCVSLWSVNVIWSDLWMHNLVFECYITCVFCIPFTYVLLGNKYLFIVIVIVIVITKDFGVLNLKYVHILHMPSNVTFHAC